MNIAKWSLSLFNDELLDILKIFSGYFLLKRKNKLSNFCFRLNFIFNQKEAENCQFSSIDGTNSRTGVMTFLFFNAVVR